MIQYLIHSIQELIGIEWDKKLLLRGVEMAKVNSISNAWLLTDNDKIADFGSMGDERLAEIRNQVPQKFQIDATNRLVIPAFCDSHTHLVYPASREVEYVDKIHGLSYEEIAKRGGGILNSARRMQELSEDQIFEEALPRLD